MAEIDDSRFDYIKIITIKLLNATDGHWAELIWKEENQAIIKDFLDSPTSIILLSFLDQDEKLSLSTNISSVRNIPKVLAYFMKSCPIVSSENCKREIMFGNISDEPLRDFQNLFEKVLHPIFSNRLNNRRWPADIANDIILHFEDFRKKLSYHVGLAQGKTMLVIPEMAKMIENFDIDNISRFVCCNFFICNINFHQFLKQCNKHTTKLLEHENRDFDVLANALELKLLEENARKNIAGFS